MTIQDEKLKPYSIKKSGSNYNVYEDTLRVNKKGEVIEELHGHFTSVENALSKIIVLKTETKNAVYNISEYVLELKRVKEIILNKQ